MKKGLEIHQLQPLDIMKPKEVLYVYYKGRHSLFVDYCVILFTSLYHVSVVRDFFRRPLSRVKAVLVIAAKHLHGNAMLFRQAPAGDHQHEAFKVVEVVALHHVQPVIIAQGRVYALEEGDWTLVFGHTRAAVHVHVVDFVTCGGRGKERQPLLLLLHLSHLKFRICRHDTAIDLVLFGFFNPLFVEIFPRNKILWDCN